MIDVPEFTGQMSDFFLDIITNYDEGKILIPISLEHISLATLEQPEIKSLQIHNSDISRTILIRIQTDKPNLRSIKLTRVHFLPLA